MNELRTLLTLELRSLFGINKFLHAGDRKEQSRYWTLCVAWVILAVTVVSYVGGLVYGLCYLGLGGIVPAYLTVLASMLILFFGIFTAGNRIFRQKGYDILASMPLKPGSIVVSRFLGLYAEDLLLTLVILLPGTVVYGLCAKPRIGFYLIAAVGTVLIPAIPLVISALLGTLILWISSRMKHKSLVQTFLMVLLVLGVFIGSFTLSPAMENFDPAAFTRLAESLGSLLGQLYPPALWLNEAMMVGKLLYLGLFALVSLGVIAIAMALVARNFHSILRRLQNFTARHDYKLGSLQSRGMLKALYLREVKRYFSSSIYVTNTIIGPILGCVMAVALCAAGADTLQANLPLPLDIPGLLPFAFAAVFCMMTTTAVSISMEGRQFWVVQSLPIPAKALFDSKLLLNLTLMLPCYLVSEIAMILALKPDFWELMWLVGIPAGIMAFSVVFGVTVNLKFHSFDWEKEEAVVKQSLPAMLGGFAGFLLAVLLGIGAFLTPPTLDNAVKGAMCLALFGAAALLYRRNNQADLSEL